MGRSPTTANRLRPQIESLEAREVPAVQLFATGQSFYIYGDAQTDTIHISDNGSGKITATAGNETVIATGINSIQIVDGTGNDKVNYQLTSRLKTVESISVAVGKGTDISSFDFTQGIGGYGHLSLSITGNTGNDKEAVALGFIWAGGTATFDLTGGQGKGSSISFHESGTISGTMSAKIHTQPADIESIWTNVPIAQGGLMSVDVDAAVTAAPTTTTTTTTTVTTSTTV